MTILLVNDDGYKAEGIIELEKVLLEYGHEVYVSAPKSEMSGMAHAMTVNRSLTITKYAENHYYMDGTPVDCILYAKRFEEPLFPKEPDLVISGINRGYNLATDILYSGTCGAAREAVFSGFKAIALSAEKLDYRIAADFVASNLDRLYSVLDDSSFININFPSSFNGKAKITIPGEVRYRDKVDLIEKDGNSYKVKISSVIRNEVKVEGELNDFEACALSYASISSVSVRYGDNIAANLKLKKAFDELG